jgi:DNA-binding NarL/FixJ family response regulator
MRRTQVVILNGGSVLSEGTAQILREAADIEVTVIPYLDRETSVRRLLKHIPDIILLDGTGPLGPDELLKVLSKQAPLDDVRVIFVHDDDNLIEVFHRRSIVATHSTDLLALVRSS